MRRQVEFYSSMQDVKKAQLCERTIPPSIDRSAFPFPSDQDRECKQHKPIHLSESKKKSRIQSGKFEEFEKVLVLWFKEARASNIPVNIELLREKAVQLSKSFEMESFSASHGWIEKFKNRHGLATRVLSGESASVNEGNVEQWKEDLAILVNVYEQKNIYNCDETGLSFN
ncbi:hypothetical protein AVEN_193333-1 [Araneus ventricosus]|uniref:HTH CENPB-type domain-containing protein n=1 Tax=Araneus ventricosus TaxID=182803 RepID=A0A4Y2EPP6_ARAVE|nr:hypothetical protein AVEN_193333-1 [Araneus ventricosus]